LFGNLGSTGSFEGGGGQFGRQLRHGDVAFGDLLQKKRPMRFELGVATRASWTRR
jgi:hypothetical protein